MCVLCRSVCCHVYVEVRLQLGGVSSLILTCGLQGSNFGHHVWCEPTHLAISQALVEFSLVKLVSYSLWRHSFLHSLSPFFSSLCRIWDRKRKLGYKCFKIFSVLHLNPWFMKHSIVKILTPLFSSYVLTTSPKAMGDSCLVSSIGGTRGS